MNDRFLAYKILNRIEHDNAYSNIALDTVLKNNDASSKSFVSALVYGVVERKITLDYIIEKFLTKPIKKLNPQVLTILRLGVYQLKFMDKIPVSAAVNESVSLTRKAKCNFASGLVNSVLRKIAEYNIEYPNADDTAYNLSIEYSCPIELVNNYINDYGVNDTRELLKASLQTPPLSIRVNTLKTNADLLIKALDKEGILAEKTDIDNCLILKNGASFINTNAYKEGLFHIQDKASQICISILSPKPNDIVLDMCSAPGGKTFTIAEYMQNKGEIFSFDLYEHRVKLINSGAERLGINIVNGQVGDSSKFNSNIPMADKILCDVPCSGLGVIRRKPEIKYKDLGFVDKLCELQYNILCCASKYLKKNGELVYSTCSLNIKENQEVCNRFLNENTGFSFVKLCDDNFLTLMPHKNGTDGFFIAKFIKG